MWNLSTDLGFSCSRTSYFLFATGDNNLFFLKYTAMSNIADLQQLNSQEGEHVMLLPPSPSSSKPKCGTWSSHSSTYPKSGILILTSPSPTPSPTPSPGSSVDDSSLLGSVPSSSRTSTSSSTTGGCIPSSTSAPNSPCVTFAPLPNIEPRVCRRGPLGVAARASLLRQRNGQRQEQASQVPQPGNRTVTPNMNANAYRSHSKAKLANTSPTSDDAKSPPPSSRSRMIDEDEDAFAVLGKIVYDASRSLWRRISSKHTKSPRKGETESSFADENGTLKSKNDSLEFKPEIIVEDTSPLSQGPHTTGPTADDSILSSFIPENMTPRALRRLRLRDRELHMDSVVKYSLKEESGEEDGSRRGSESSDEYSKSQRRKKSSKGRTRAEDVDPMIRTIREDSDVEIDDVTTVAFAGVDSGLDNTSSAGVVGPFVREPISINSTITFAATTSEVIVPRKTEFLTALSEATTIEVCVVDSDKLDSPTTRSM